MIKLTITSTLNHNISLTDSVLQTPSTVQTNHKLRESSTEVHVENMHVSNANFCNLLANSHRCVSNQNMLSRSLNTQVFLNIAMYNMMCIN